MCVRELFEIDGPKIREWNFTGLVPNKKTIVKMTLPDNLKKGAYELRFSSGNLTDHEWFRLMDKPTAGSYFDESGYLVLDGRKFFPVGIVTPSSAQDSLRVYSESGINVITANVLRLGLPGPPCARGCQPSTPHGRQGRWTRTWAGPPLWRL